MDADKLVICTEDDFVEHRNALDVVNFERLDELVDDDHLVIPTGKSFWESLSMGMQELAQKKRWMFARGSFAPPLVLFEEKTYADKPSWRDATPVLGAPNRPLGVEFKVSTQYRAGYHVSAEIPAVDFCDDQRLVFLKYYGPGFGLRYIGAMYVTCLQDIAKGYKGISTVMQARYNLSLPDNVDYFRLLGCDKVEKIDMSPPMVMAEGKVGLQLAVPNHGEIIVLQSSTTPMENSFALKFSTFPRFATPEPVPRTLTFGEQLLEDAEAGFIGVDVKFVGGPDDKKYTITAHRSALCTTEYFRRLFTRGVKDPQPPPVADKEGFYLITPPSFANETTMRQFIRWIYTRRVDKELKLDVQLCLNLIRLGNYCVVEDLVHDCVEVIGRVKSFDVSSALDALELADAIEDSEATILRRRAMQYVVAHFEEVAAAERFHKLVGTSVYYAIIAAVYQWSVYYAQLASQHQQQHEKGKATE